MNIWPPPNRKTHSDHQDEAIRQLYWWIANELDPDPGPVEDYITDPLAQAAAKRAVTR